jgi:hypothetical protein
MVGGTSGKLTDKGIKSFIARKVIGSKLADGQGLYLLITRAKTASWRIKYRIEGKEKKLHHRHLSSEQFGSGKT